MRSSPPVELGRDQRVAAGCARLAAHLVVNHRALPPKAARLPLGLCLSGGADSCALALAASHAQAELERDIVALHARHGLRGTESEGDRLAVRELCARLGLPLIEVDAVISPGANLEARARQARYQALREAFPGLLVTAHHQGDQAETVVLRLLRGAGPTGLRGIHALRKDGIWRPFLAVPGSLFKEACREAAWTWREDASNRDQRFLRNWIRHSWLPENGTEVEEALATLATSAEALAPALEARLASLEARCSLSFDPSGFRLDLQSWRGESDHPELDLLLERIWNRMGRRPWATAQRRRLVDDVLSGHRGRRKGGQNEIALWGDGILQVRIRKDILIS